MIEHFSGALLMERTAATMMAKAIESCDQKRLDVFKRGPRALCVRGTEVILNARRENTSGMHPRTALAMGGDQYGGGYQIVNGIAIIGIFGPMFKNYGPYGYADQVEIQATVRAATMDRTVSGIMLVIDSPGGSVSGTPELATEIYAANAVKPVMAFIDGLCASAAYWAACGARAIYSNSTSMAGSVGVIMSIMDASKAYDAAGIKVTNIKTGEFKDTGDPSQPATKAGISYLQDICDQIGALFFADVARGRGISLDRVRNMQAKIYLGADAVRVGLVNGGSTTFDTAWDLLRRASDQKYRAGVERMDEYRAIIQKLESETLEN